MSRKNPCTKMTIVAGFLAAALGCSSEEDSAVPRTLTAKDVSGLPSGSATGTAASGIYLLESSEMSGCVCRIGSCSEIRGADAGSFTLTQTDGSLHVVLRGQYNDTTYDGGIDADGSFRVGGGVDAESVIAHALLSGVVVAGASLHADSELTLVGRVDGKDYDCDVSVKLTATYLAPLRE